MNDNTVVRGIFGVCTGDTWLSQYFVGKYRKYNQNPWNAMLLMLDVNTAVCVGAVYLPKWWASPIVSFLYWT